MYYHVHVVLFKQSIRHKQKSNQAMYQAQIGHLHRRSEAPLHPSTPFPAELCFTYPG